MLSFRLVSAASVSVLAVSTPSLFGTSALGGLSEALRAPSSAGAVSLSVPSIPSESKLPAVSTGWSVPSEASESFSMSFSLFSSVSESSLDSSSSLSLPPKRFLKNPVTLSQKPPLSSSVSLSLPEASNVLSITAFYPSTSSFVSLMMPPSPLLEPPVKKFFTEVHKFWKNPLSLTLPSRFSSVCFREFTS